MGIEPTPSDWKSEALPLCNGRVCHNRTIFGTGLAGVGGLEPPTHRLTADCAAIAPHAIGLQNVALCSDDSSNPSGLDEFLAAGARCLARDVDRCSA